MLACVLVIYGVFYLSVVGRIHQFGQLRTIGMTKKQLRKFVSREDSALYIRSAPMGIVMGIFAGYVMIPDGFRAKNALFAIVFVLAAVFLITMLSVRKPARIAAASPVEALRYVPRDGMKRAAGRRVCRSLTSLGLGMMNFSRNKRKAAVTMLSLSLGGILFMTAAAYMSSFDRENYSRQSYFANAEFHLMYAPSAVELNENGMAGLQTEGALGEEMIRRLLSLDGVKEVEVMKGFGVRYDYPKKDEYNANDIVYPMTQEETREIEGYLEEGTAGYEKLMSGDYILMADNDLVEEIYGWRFEVGDTLMLHYYDGRQAAEKEVTLLGILSRQYVIDSKGIEGWFRMPEEAILALLSHDNLNTDLLIAVEGDREEAVGASLGEMLEELPDVSMETLAERRAADKQNVDRLFGAISGLAVFIMMFSLLSMMNTLITNIVTRKQELAMLESIGMDRGQIQRMLLGESLFLALVTVGMTLTVGALCGYGLSHFLYRIGAFYMAFRFPGALALAYTGVLILVPLVITFVSLRRFSKEALVERLRGTEIKFFGAENGKF